MDDYGSSLGREQFHHDPNDPRLVETINLADLLDQLSPLRSLDPRWDGFIKSLPKITEQDLNKLGLDHDTSCPICFVSLPGLLAEEEMGYATDSSAYAAGELGVTRLEKSCSHIFCRKDITKWIRAGKESCPMCRAALLPPRPGHVSSETPTVAEGRSPVLGANQDDEEFMRFLSEHNISTNSSGSGDWFTQPPPNTQGQSGRRGAEDHRSEFSSMYS